MADYKLSPVSLNDAPSLAKNNISAFWEEKWWNLLWTTETREELIEAVAARTPKNLLTEREVRRHQMVVHVPSGEIVGYARWILPGSLAHEWTEAQTPDVSEEQRKKCAEDFANAKFNPRGDMDAIDDPIHEMQRKHAPEAPHIKLDYLCCRPDHQRKDVAGRLVRSGIEQANRLGVDIFLVAMGGNALGMYKKHGFRQLDELVQPLKPWGAESDDDVYETYILVKNPTSE